MIPSTIIVPLREPETREIWIALGIMTAPAETSCDVFAGADQ